MKLNDKQIARYDKQIWQIQEDIAKLKQKQTDIIDEALYSNDLYEFKTLNEIKVIIDSSCSMASVELNDECIFLGNYWDFHPGCHGGRHRLLSLISDFSNPASFVQALAKYMSIKYQKFEIKTFRGTYEEAGSCYFVDLVERDISNLKHPGAPKSI